MTGTNAVLQIEALSSQDRILSWKSVVIEAQGVTIEAERGAYGKLSSLLVSIEGKKIEISNECQKGFIYPILKDIEITQGHWDNGTTTGRGEKYWTIHIPYRTNYSKDRKGEFRMFFTDKKLVYTEIDLKLVDGTEKTQRTCEY